MTTTGNISGPIEPMNETNISEKSRHPMRVCFLSSMHPPRDKRVLDKEAISLAQAGFEVIHLAPDES